VNEIGVSNMMKIEEIEKKYSNYDKDNLKINFLNLLNQQWRDMRNKFEKTQVNQSFKFRFLYLYDEIMNMVEDKYSNIEISFFILNNKRLEKNYQSHDSEYQNCLDILNLFSDIEHYLKNVDDITLKQIHHLSDGTEVMKNNEIHFEEGILC